VSTPTLSSLLIEIETSLREQLNLHLLAAPAHLSLMQGQWKGQDATLNARTYRGPHVSYARFVDISGPDLDIANMLILAEPGLGLPILGADLVDVGRPSAVAVVDLTPLDSTDWPLAAPGVASLTRPPCPPLPSAGELPSWARKWLSRTALFAAVPPDERGAVRCHLAASCTRFVELIGQASADEGREGRARARQQEYCSAHRSEDRGLQLLGRVFDPGLANRFLREVLFPDPDQDWVWD